MGYKIYFPELKEIVIGVNCLFNEVIPTYTEEYFAELNKIKIETVEDSSTGTCTTAPKKLTPSSLYLQSLPSKTCAHRLPVVRSYVPIRRV